MKSTVQSNVVPKAREQPSILKVAWHRDITHELPTTTPFSLPRLTLTSASHLRLLFARVFPAVSRVFFRFPPRFDPFPPFCTSDSLVCGERNKPGANTYVRHTFFSFRSNASCVYTLLAFYYPFSFTQTLIHAPCTVRATQMHTLPRFSLAR